MYSYSWDSETGGLTLYSTPLVFSKEPRPVYYQELDILGFDQFWKYDRNDMYPYLWAESNNYYYRGRLVAKVKGGAIFKAPEIIILDDPEPNGGQLRYIDIPAMVEKNRGLLEKLTQDTIKKIYNTYVDYRNKVDVFYVAFSGGKDSVVAFDLVQRALPHNEIKVLFGDTGMEFPDTYRVVDQIKEVCEREGIDFLTSKCVYEPEYTWQQFGPPAQTMRWCCSVHKTAPQIIKLREFTGNPHFRGMAFTGIRGDESASRSEYDSVSLGEKIRGQYSCHPILEWNSAELFLYIFSRNLVLNDAYKKGNSRAGCLVCPLAASKNMFFKEQAYSTSSDNSRTTTTFNEIILKTTAKELSSPAAVEEYMNIGGWKARRSGRELKFAKDLCVESNEKGTMTIRLLQQKTDWHEWIKTVGNVIFLENGDMEIEYDDKLYYVSVNTTDGEIAFTVDIESNTKSDIYFMSALKTVLRKTAYCIGCRVCEANCPNGYISILEGNVRVDNRCIKCKKCHDIPRGCLVSNSLRLPKGERKMGSIDRYGNMGIEYSWVQEYFEKKDEFWDSPHSLGKNMIKNLKAFLNDSEITQKGMFSPFGKLVDHLGIETETAWALIACNLAYTSEFNWWIKNIDFSYAYTPDEIYALLDDSMSVNSRNHIVSAFKNIFISNAVLANEVGMGQSEYEIKGGKKYLTKVVRTKWGNPNPIVILYGLYKFAEACSGYYQFTLSRLLDFEVESDGISPAQVFGLDRGTMEKTLVGLNINYPEFITAQFNLDLDTITLNEEKSSSDVLSLF